MLVLSRHKNERILIGTDIIVTVCDFKHPRGDNPAVRLGITAPEHIKILREEIADLPEDGTENGRER